MVPVGAVVVVSVVVVPVGVAVVVPVGVVVVVPVGVGVPPPTPLPARVKRSVGAVVVAVGGVSGAPDLPDCISVRPCTAREAIKAWEAWEQVPLSEVVWYAHMVARMQVHTCKQVWSNANMCVAPCQAVKLYVSMKAELAKFQGGVSPAWPDHSGRTHRRGRAPCGRGSGSAASSGLQGGRAGGGKRSTVSRQAVLCQEGWQTASDLRPKAGNSAWAEADGGIAGSVWQRRRVGGRPAGTGWRQRGFDHKVGQLVTKYFHKLRSAGD